jgi:hypothetical protein
VKVIQQLRRVPEVLFAGVAADQTLALHRVVSSEVKGRGPYLMLTDMGLVTVHRICALQTQCSRCGFLEGISRQEF